jgi:hypothetical protein
LAGSLTLVTSRSEMDGNDLIDWGQLPGPTLTIFSTPVSVISNGGMGATLTTSVGTVFKDQQGSPWQGNFALGDHLVGMGQLTPSIPMDITFAQSVSGLGAQLGYDIISATPFPFTEALNLYDGASFAADNSAVFIGATDTPARLPRQNSSRRPPLAPSRAPSRLIR